MSQLQENQNTPPTTPAPTAAILYNCGGCNGVFERHLLDINYLCASCAREYEIAVKPIREEFERELSNGELYERACEGGVTSSEFFPNDWGECVCCHRVIKKSTHQNGYCGYCMDEFDPSNPPNYNYGGESSNPPKYSYGGEFDKQYLRRKEMEIADDEDFFLSLPQHPNSIFEVNLAEFPISTFSKKNARKSGQVLTRYEYTDAIKGENNVAVPRKWVIEARGRDSEGRELGFGGSGTFEVIYELFQMWREQGFWRTMIYIGTYYNFLKRLGWGTSKADYDRLKQILDCTVGLFLRGENCFYFRDTKEYGNVQMNLFSGVVELHKNEYNEDCKNRRLFVEVSQTLISLILNHRENFYLFNIAPEDFKKYTPMEKKVALMICKFFSIYKIKTEWKRDIFKFAGQVPIESKELYDIRKQIKKVCLGLMAKKFSYLSDFKFVENNVIFIYERFDKKDNENEICVKKEKEETVPEHVEDNGLLNYLKNNISKDPRDFPFFVKVINCIPDDVYRLVSEAKDDYRRWKGSLIRRFVALAERAIKLQNKACRKKTVTKPKVEQTELKFGEPEVNLDRKPETQITAVPTPPPPPLPQNRQMTIKAYLKNKWEGESEAVKSKYMVKAVEETKGINPQKITRSLEEYAIIFYGDYLETIDVDYKQLIIENKPKY